MNDEQPSTSLQAKEHHLQYILTCYILILLPIYYSSHSLYKLTVAIIKELTNFLYLHVHCCTVFCPCTTDTSWCTSCMWLPSLWCLASGQPLPNLSLTPFPALSYHTQLMHTDLQVVVWEYSQDTEYKFLGEVSIPNRYISIQFMVHQIYVSSHLYNLPR